ncbi:hypothetical protein RHD99_10295 [Buttiauxella selenatireducens]|uniref:Uncharacterized protein n=1 Tax=Buttiauxella selenatireducens TaxID=3073902 RepID=A0ABY9SIN0_9ENTR|nr:hypothetical protein [Buttiauxella sp. R73]WMY76281.1 hypothetical protein RHD99_10295 [Buttiauxella sp. R73]
MAANFNFYLSQQVGINTTTLDVIDLAERCELLTDVLMDCINPAESAALCHHLNAHLDALKENLEKTLSPDRIEQLSVNSPSDFPESHWLADSDDLCDYCQVITQILLCHSLPLKTAHTLTGLLARLVNTLVDDLRTPRFLREQSV